MTLATPTIEATAPPPELLAEVRLASVRGVGPRVRAKLVAAFGDAGEVLRRPADELCRVEGVGAKLAAAIRAAPSAAAAAEELADAGSIGVQPMLAASPDYPRRLLELCDAPPVLYCRGEVRPEDARAIAIVGTRRASRYGLKQAAELATGLARAGVTVVSGLARGVDGAAHRACLEAGGRTLAVLAGGLMRIYPPEHKQLADDVARRGALLAESPPRMPPMSGSFPQRNRIISGVSIGVVVVEAARRSGAMITARHAAEQGRDVFAVPGQLDNPQSAGCHQLIQEGAKLITSVDDILAELEMLDACGAIDSVGVESVGEERSRCVNAPVKPPPDGEVARAIWEAVGTEATLIDTLVEETGFAAQKVLAVVSVLEVSGHLTRVSGSAVVRR